MTSIRSRSLSRLSGVAIIVAALLMTTDAAWTCGPDFERAVFTHVAHPDYPMPAYAAGNLGVIQKTYARSYLAVAFRYLADRPLGTSEQRDVVALWNQRLGVMGAAGTSPEDALKRWLGVRRAIRGAAAEGRVDLFRPVARGAFFDYANCLAPAFANAATTLERIVGTGNVRGPAGALEWVQAQDQVFANCGGGDEVVPPLAAGATAPAQADRAYQIAAAHFYAQRFDAAIAEFERIAADAASPWRTIAPYLVARAWTRKGTLTLGEGQIDRAPLERAAAELDRILGDQGRASLHAAARSLQGFVRFRLDPQGRLGELAARVASAQPDVPLTQALDDYTRLLDRLVGEVPPAQFAALRAVARTDMLTDWITTFQSPDSSSADHAVERWRSTRATPWLVAALSKIGPSHQAAAELREAAALLAPGAAGYPTTAYHLARLAIERNDLTEARTALDAMLARNRAAWPRSTVNQLLALRMRVSATFDEFLTFALRQAAGSSLVEDYGAEVMPPGSRLKGREQEPMFDADATFVVNDQLPLSQMIDAATRASLPSRVRQSIAIAAWTRAILLGDDASGVRAASILGTLAPELREDLASYTSAAGADDRRLAAVTAILRSPGLRPFMDAGLEREAAVRRVDPYRDNWWCQVAPAAAGPAPLFSTKESSVAAAGERARLAGIATAPNVLAREAVRLAGLRASDPRAPEILHLAVRATRYGCTDEGTGAASKAAFDLLHKRYPASDWAKKTPFWFK